MESPIAIYQLIILYMLHRADGKVSTGLLSGFLLGSGFANFVSMGKTFQEIEDNGFVTSQRNGDLEFLTITEEGEQTLRFFRSTLSDEICREADEYLKANGRKLRQEKNLTSEYFPAAGSYTVRLKVIEEKKTLLEINLNVPNEETARKAAENWKKSSGTIYSAVIEGLLGKK